MDDIIIIENKTFPNKRNYKLLLGTKGDKVLRKVQ